MLSGAMIITGYSCAFPAMTGQKVKKTDVLVLYLFNKIENTCFWLAARCVSKLYYKTPNILFQSRV